MTTLNTLITGITVTRIPGGYTAWAVYLTEYSVVALRKRTDETPRLAIANLCYDLRSLDVVVPDEVELKAVEEYVFKHEL